jgi:predicted membrane GTPase involved in stress response
MRREGFEFALSPPRVLYKQDEDGTKLEPIGKKKIKKNDFFGIKIN